MYGYQPEKKLVYRAGLIPYIIENGEVQMLFMRPSDTTYGGDAFQIAKGRIEDNEDPQHAALREAKEEVGLFIGNVIKTEEVGTFMGRTTLFVSKVKDKDMFGEPDFETDATKWMSMSDFVAEGRSLHVPVVLAAYRQICKDEGISPQSYDFLLSH